VTSDKTEPNLYSRNWFRFFHVEIDQGRTAQEIEFISNCAPLPDFRRILDFCCGMGRHARELAQRGYSVLGMDRDAIAIAKARELDFGPTYVLSDIRNYQPAPAGFDAVIVMGQSFGHFDDTTNRDLLLKLSSALRQRGRVLLDLWNPEFFITNQGERDLHTPLGTVHEKKRVEHNQLFVHLEYPDGSSENFQWQLFTPAQMGEIAHLSNLLLLNSCSGFELTRAPSPVDPRIQFVLQRRS
jgi:SAM-dependent methyltransferase